MGTIIYFTEGKTQVEILYLAYFPNGNVSLKECFNGKLTHKRIFGIVT